jgi:hypothetical protein
MSLFSYLIFTISIVANGPRFFILVKYVPVEIDKCLWLRTMAATAIVSTQRTRLFSFHY